MSHERVMPLVCRSLRTHKRTAGTVRRIIESSEEGGCQQPVSVAVMSPAELAGSCASSKVEKKGGG